MCIVECCYIHEKGLPVKRQPSFRYGSVGSIFICPNSFFVAGMRILRLPNPGRWRWERVGIAMKYRIVNILTVIGLVALLSVHYFIQPVHWLFFGGVLVLYSLVVFLGCIKISWSFFLPVVCRAAINDQIVALTFDDGPTKEFTPVILETLKKYNVPAAFFCIGKNIDGNEAILQQINEGGHIIGNHSNSHHFWFDMFGTAKMLADLAEMDEKVRKITGETPLLFRPPYGVTNPNLAKAILKGKYRPIGWSVRSMDTVATDRQKLLTRITGQLRPGDIILLHDSLAITADILPEVIQQIINKGYKIERVDKMLQIQSYK